MLRDWATHALDRAGIPWRIAYTSTTVTGLEAAVRAGIAVGVFREATISKRLRILGAKEGLPRAARIRGLAGHRAAAGAQGDRAARGVPDPPIAQVAALNGAPAEQPPALSALALGRD